MSPKKSGGLAANPLLSRTEPESGEPEQPSEEARTPAHPQTRTPSDTSSGTNKFTFYFTDDQLERLDEAWTAVRRRTRGTKRRITKSLFVRLALNRLLSEFEKDREEIINELLAQSERGE